MRSRRSLAAALALALALGAGAAPVAWGAPQGSPRDGTTIVRVTDRSGFDWADAGIGAAGGAALSLLGVGLALLRSNPKGETQ